MHSQNRQELKAAFIDKAANDCRQNDIPGKEFTMASTETTLKGIYDQPNFMQRDFQMPRNSRKAVNFEQDLIILGVPVLIC